MEHVNFENLLREKMGLDPVSVGGDTVERAVASRMLACGLSDKEDYWQRLQTYDDEVQELIEAVIVPETWFFRDREAFEALGSLIVEDWSVTHSGVNLHLLSAPCSTGEEPYSMVMALLDAGFPRERIKLDAIDISIRALAHAQKGIYGTNSFRGKDSTYRDRYFEKAPTGYALSMRIRDAVSIHHGNLLSTTIHFGAYLYDVIFCRNLLIYFDKATQDRVLESLGRVLAPDGLLFVGPAEAFLATSRGFKSVNRSLAFAFRKRTSPTLARNDFRPPAIKKEIKPRAVPAVSGPRKVVAPALPSVVPVAKPESDLAAAYSLADHGKLEQALAACENHVKRHGATAESYYLLGLIHDAKGDQSRAEVCYRRVLYLEPCHGEALAHLALLSERQGDAQSAGRLRARAERQEHEHRNNATNREARK
jgi:chemotaxis protein methyltransferase WspC